MTTGKSAYQGDLRPILRTVRLLVDLRAQIQRWHGSARHSNG